MKRGPEVLLLLPTPPPNPGWAASPSPAHVQLQHSVMLRQQFAGLPLYS